MKGLEHYKKKEHLSPSSLCVMSRCPRKYFYQCGVGLTSLEESLPLLFGEAMHCALPFSYTGELDKALAAFDEVWQDREGDKVRSRGKAIRLISTFAKTHTEGKCIYCPFQPPEETKAKVNDPRSAYELPFAVDIGLDIPLVGRIDCVAKHRDTGNLCGVEFKTAARTGTTYFQAFTRSPQIIAYTLALELLMRAEVETFFLEVIPTKVSEDSSQILPINFMSSYYEDFLKWVGLIYAQIKACEKVEDWPQNFAGCNSYASYGMAGYSCDYEPLCQLPDWTDGIDLYRIRPPQPFQM